MCVYIYIYIYTHTHTHAHAHAHDHARAHASFISTTTKPLPDSATNTDYDTLTMTAFTTTPICNLRHLWADVAHMYIYTYAYIADTFVRTILFKIIHKHTCTHVHTRAKNIYLKRQGPAYCMYVRTCVHTYTRTHIHTSITHIRTNIHGQLFDQFG